MSVQTILEPVRPSDFNSRRTKLGIGPDKVDATYALWHRIAIHDDLSAGVPSFEFVSFCAGQSILLSPPQQNLSWLKSRPDNSLFHTGRMQADFASKHHQ